MARSSEPAAPERAAAARAVPRSRGLDAIKGLAILLVVTIHAAPAGPSWYFDHVVQGLARLGVPLFLVVTGFLAGQKATPRARFAAYFRRFLWLHVFYALFYWALSIVQHGLPTALGLKDVLLRFGAGAWPGQYYLAVLLQLFALAAFLLPEGCLRRRRSVFWTAALLVAGSLLLALARAQTGDPPWLRLVERARENPFWLWLYYLALGGLLGERAGWLLDRLGARAGLLSACAALAGAGLALWSPGIGLFAGAEPPLVYARPPIYLGATLVALALPWASRLRAASLGLTALGRESFGLYVFNPAILAGLFAVVGRPERAWASLLLVAACVAIGQPLSAHLRVRLPWLFP